jgi:hypothetical protein
MVKNVYIRLKKIILFFLITFSFNSYSQDTIKLHLKDYHSAQITDIIASKDEKNIYTIDNSGKILSYNTVDFSFESTIRKPDGLYITNPRLVNNDKHLFFASNDSLTLLNLKGEVLVRKPFKLKIINKINSKYLVFANYQNYLTTEISISDKNFKPIKSFKTNGSISQVSVNNDASKILYIGVKSNGNPQKLTYRDLKNDRIIWESTIEDSHKIIHTFFDEKYNEIYAITFSRENKTLSVYKYKNGTRSKSPEATINAVYSGSNFSIEDVFFDYNTIILTKRGDFSIPFIIKSKNGKFSMNRIKSGKVGYAVSYLKSKSKIVIANTYHESFSDIANFSVHETNNKNTISIHPNFTKEFYSGFFLPDDSFLMYGMDRNAINPLEGKGLQIKFFSKGTFYNRFNTLSFKDYLEINHKVYFSSNFIFNKEKGLIIFRGIDLTNNKYFIFKYNFIKDKTTKLHTIKKDYFLIDDYDPVTNKLILNSGSSSFSKYNKIKRAIVDNDEIIELEGAEYAKFSEGAKHTLTISENNIVQIRDNNFKIIFEEQLRGGNYIVNKAEDGFIVSNTFQQVELGKCFKESFIFILQKDNSFKSERKDCLYVNDLISKNKKTVLLINDLGIIVDEKLIPIGKNNSPKSISLNKDASKLMVSYANGRTGIIDTKTNKEIGGMLHPSKKEHIFYDTNNHYFSNMDAKDFIFSTKNQQKVSLKSVDSFIYKPQEVLNIFSTPNQKYVTLLKKAISVRKNKKEFGEIKTAEVVDSNNTAVEKGDLYVLSIGVSKYKQSNYNLTFADKDAFDIASIYGKLDSTTIKNFKNDFLGNEYVLQSKEDNNLTSLNNFDSYQNIGNTYALDSESEIWLDINYDKAFIWNFKANKIEKINLPKDFKRDIYSKQIFNSSNKDEVYLRTIDSEFYNLNYISKEITKIKLPFEFKYNDYENYSFIQGNKWVYLTQLNNRNEFQTLIASENETKIDTVTYKLNKFLYKKDTIQLKSYDGLFPKFKSITSNGDYVLFTDSNDNAYKLKLSKNEIPTKFDIKIKDEASISEDGNKITVLSSLLKNYRYKMVNYNLDGKVLDSITFVDKDFRIKGISILNAKPKWIKEYEPLVDSYNYSLFSSFDLLSKNTPFSFNKTFVKKLTNNEATKENIELEISDFLKDTKKEDQIIVFIAGHGVLDKNKNYYYAPYNMDFKNVENFGVSFKTIIKGLGNSKAQNKLLLMDTCHSGNTLDLESNNNGTQVIGKDGERGTITRTNRKKPTFKISEIVGTLFDDFMSKSGITILSASSGSDVAYENKELSNGAFTSAYLKVLKNKFGYLPKSESLEKSVIIDANFISDVLKEVMILTKGKQVPDIREINKNVIIKAW